MHTTIKKESVFTKFAESTMFLWQLWMNFSGNQQISCVHCKRSEQNNLLLLHQTSNSYIQYRLEVLTPRATGKPLLCRGQWPRVHRGEKDFQTQQNQGGVYRGKFAAGEKTRHATVKKNTFWLMKYFNPRVIQSLLTFESVKYLWKHDERKRFKFHLIHSVIRISQCVSRWRTSL